MPMRLYDAHNHLQDDRLKPFLPVILESLAREPMIVRMVVNGSSEEDWPAVRELARQCPRVLPSFGYHPWYIKERSPRWHETLLECLHHGTAVIGEIGLDRWIKDFDLPQQEEVFVWQFRLAAERNLPVSIHCLKAWGRLYDLLRDMPRPARGFLLHSYGGPREMVRPLSALGAYFSFPGYYAWERKLAQREIFRQIPPDRLLVETDAPDQLLPEALDRFGLREAATGDRLNHPGNLLAVYTFLADWLGKPLDRLAGEVEANFLRFFGT